VTISGWVEFLILFGAVIAITPVLGAYMARV
jgi:hypothetical protein